MAIRTGWNDFARRPRKDVICINNTVWATGSTFAIEKSVCSETFLRDTVECDGIDDTNLYRQYYILISLLHGKWENNLKIVGNMISYIFRCCQFYITSLISFFDFGAKHMFLPVSWIFPKDIDDYNISNCWFFIKLYRHTTYFYKVIISSNVTDCFLLFVRIMSV